MVPEQSTLSTFKFPSVTAAIKDGIDRRMHTGVQIYVSHQDSTILNAAHGDASPGNPMTSSTIMPWRSAGKPLTAVLIMRQIELGQLRLTSRLEELLPETRGTEIAAVTVFDLLTHQSGFPQTDTGWPYADWSESLLKITWEPRQLEIGTAAYHPQSSWFLLGEILRQLEPIPSAVSFNAILQRDLLNPLGMSATMCGVPSHRFHEDWALLPNLYEREQGQLKKSSWMDEPWLTRSSPGGNFRGPVRDLGRFFELLMRQGKLSDGASFVSAATVHQMTTRQRSGAYDQTLQHGIDFGLGVICDSKKYGLETVPYGFGRYCSEATFGHGGSQCSMGFCDPEHALVVAWSANGFCGEGQHQRRNRMINEAVYRDLGLAN